MRRLLAVLLLSSTFTLAQPAPCPVKYVEVDPQWRHGLLFRLKFTNLSDKTITAAKFRVEMIDAVGDKHAGWWDYTLDTPVKPGKTEDGSVDNRWQSQYKKANVYLLKAVFADGSTFEDDGTHSCASGPMGREKK